MITDFKLDMTMMYAVHDALRRDLEPVAQMTARSEGWDFFERFLQAHHVAEDDALWPVVREGVAGRTEDLAILDDMAAEHAALGPLLEAINDALDRGESAPGARADLAVLSVDLDAFLAADERLPDVRAEVAIVDGLEVPTA